MRPAGTPGPRLRRLERDLAELRAAAGRAELAFEAEGAPPERYVVTVEVPGLSRESEGEPVIRTIHRFEAYLPVDYPRRAPLLRWLTPVFHPNILPPARNGGVCIGWWSPSESLADLSGRLARMVAWRSFSLDDVLDEDAAGWARAVGARQGDAPADLLQRAAIPSIVPAEPGACD